MNTKGLYTVERRGCSYAVYSPSGNKIESYLTYKDAKAKANELNKELKNLMNI